MAEFEQEEFEFPDEKEVKAAAPTEEAAPVEEKFEVEVEDDTPEEDRGRTPVSIEAIKKLEVDTDDLDKYSKDAKDKLIKMKRVWHDERRAKEEAYREQQEAVRVAQKLLEENKRIKSMLESGGKEYATTLQTAADLQLAVAKDKYRKAYDAGDTEALVEAQQEMNEATLKVMQAKNFKMPSLQEENFEVQTQYEQPQAPVRDRRAEAWRDQNPWFGQDEEMTASALGLHEKLKRNGVLVGSDEYYATLDRTIRKRFAEYFDEPEEPKAEPVRTKPSTVVAPATRSTASNKIKLSRSQVALSKKLGLTPEQYALELKKLEA